MTQRPVGSAAVLLRSRRLGLGLAAWAAALTAAAATPADNADDEAAAVPESDTCGGLDVGLWTQPERPMIGYDVLCVSRGSEACKDGGAEGDGDATCPAAAGSSMRIAAWWAGLRQRSREFVVGSVESLLQFEEELGRHRELVNPTRYNRIKKALEKKSKWKGLHAFFKVTAAGEVPQRITSPDGLTGLVLVYEGGNFLWPGVQVGFQRNITVRPAVSSETLDLQLLTRSLVPLVVEVSRFLTDEECDHIIKKATPHIAKSGVSHMDHDVGKPATNWRSSSTYFMPSDDDIIQRLDRRVSALTGTRVNQQEFAQILRYERGERYAAHHDFFNIDMYKKDQGIQGLTKKGLFNRLATVFFYMTDVEAGGQTAFPRAGGLPQPIDYEDCTRGMSVEARKGRIIVFYSQNAAAVNDEYSLHGGCAVEEGTKWSANKWIWSTGMHFLSHSA